MTTTQTQYRPFGLLMELTFRCPLHCPYCSNPTKFPATKDELTTYEWLRVVNEAAEMGVLQLLISGGEPLLRQDLEKIVSAARDLGLYTNLITSAIGLSRDRALNLKQAGLDSIQISFQADEAILGDSIAGARAHEHKRTAAYMVRELGFPLTINIVLHQANMHCIPGIIDFTEHVGAERLELANTQFYGWAFRNKETLLPARFQIEEARDIVTLASERLRGKVEILYILPDYFSDRPKPCMNGWGQRYITVNPVGEVLPCSTAAEIPGMYFENVRDHPLLWIWRESEAFNKFRGTSWMPEPCSSCDRKAIDWGGCRCQAALLTGDPSNADPVCGLSPHHDNLLSLVAPKSVPGAPKPTEELISQLQFRQNPPSS
jgi:pyrroloquinoline quinone biosynthesis protein E